MTKRTNIASYPKEIPDTLYKVIDVKAREANPFEVKFKSAKAAKSGRRQFYSFRDTLYDQPELYPDLALIAPFIKFSLKGAKLFIYLEEIERNNNALQRIDEAESLS